MSVVVGKRIFYTVDEVKKIDALYKLIYGGREIGKSFSVKTDCLKESWEDTSNQSNFAYIRRWDNDIKTNLCDSYFSSEETCNFVKKITKGKCNAIKFFRGSFYFANIGEDGEIEKIKLCGHAFSLSKQERYKSLEFTDIKYAIFEEWNTDQGYLVDEVKKLESLISTIRRHRQDFSVYMLANTISRVCPYIEQWGLANFMRQEQGTIDIYTHYTGEVDENGELVNYKLVCQYCAETSLEVGKKDARKEKAIELLEKIKNNKFAYQINNSMEKYGNWETSNHPIISQIELSNRVRYSQPMHTIVFELDNYKFLMQLFRDNLNQSYFWYVSRKTSEIKKGTRIISNKYKQSKLWTCLFTPLTNEEKIAFNFLKNNQIMYTDNLTGQEFLQCMKEMKKL